MIIGISKKGLNIFCWALFLVISSAYLFAANAEYTVRVLELENNKSKETTTILHVLGDYDEGIHKATKEALESHDIDRAVLFSPGGSAYEGYSMANLFSTHKVKTYVAKGTYCLSACAVAFTGGEDYKVNNGILGFHKAYIPADTFENQQEAFASGSTAGTYNFYFMLANGFSAEFAFAINEKTTPDDFIVFTNEEDFMKHHVRTEENSIDSYFQNNETPFTIWSGDQMKSFLEANENEANEWTVTKTLFKSTNKVAK